MPWAKVAAGVAPTVWRAFRRPAISMFKDRKFTKTRSIAASRNSAAKKVSAVQRGIPLGLNPFGNSRVTTLKYHYAANLNTATSAGTLGTENLFKLNDVFDPAVGAESKQPLGFAEFATMFNRYRVISAQVTVRFAAADTSNVLDAVVSIQNSSQSQSLTSQLFVYAIEWKNTQYITMAPGGEHKSQIGPVFVDLRKLEGEGAFTHSDDYQALVSTSPVASPVVRVAFGNRSADTQVGFYYDIEILYRVRFYDSKITARTG